MRDRKGFTLLELLVVIAIIGVLALVALPRFAFAARQKTLDAEAKSDLRNAMIAQEAYFVDHQTYASDLASLDLTTSKGVIIGGVATAGGYSMTARHAGSDNVFSIEIGGESSSNLIR